jgi:hypothetical protein
LVVQPGWHSKGRLPYRLVQNQIEYEESLFNMQYSVFRSELGMDGEVLLFD